MTIGKLSFGNNQESSNDPLTGSSPLAINVIVDGGGAVKRRPGISTWNGEGTPAFDKDIIGISDDYSDVFFASGSVSGIKYVGKIASGTQQSLSTASGPIYDIDGTTQLGVALPFMASTGRPVFTSTGNKTAVTDGGIPLIYDAGDAATYGVGMIEASFYTWLDCITFPYSTDGAALFLPPPSTHIVAYADRLVSNDVTPNTATARYDADVRFSRVQARYSLWDPLDFIRATSKGDSIVALAENANELLTFKDQSLVMWVKDSVLSSAENSGIVPSRTVNVGCSAPYSIIQDVDNFAWLDDRRMFVMSDGRNVQEIGGAISATTRAIANVSDCFGWKVVIDSNEFLVWVFPSDGRTFAFQKGGGWAQWHGWSGGHTLLPIKSGHYYKPGNVNLVGLAGGRIMKLDQSAGTDNGSPFKAEVLTGFIDRETSAKKTCNCLSMTFRRGQTATANKVYLSWRNDLGAFNSPMEISLGSTGDANPVVRLHGLGSYRTRQWKLEMSDTSMTLANVEEDFTVSA
jgi:hypothetical protein